MDKTLLKIFLIILTLVSFFSIWGSRYGGLQAERILDLECQRQKLLDPSYVPPPPFDPDCTIDTNFTAIFVAPEKCSGTCSLNLGERCIAKTDTSLTPPSTSYNCKLAVDETGAQCGDPDCIPDKGKKCAVYNILSAEIAGSGDLWECREFDNIFSLNPFGTNLGPADVAIARIIRTSMTIFLIVYAVMNFYKLFYALWETTTKRDSEGYENAQKTVKNSAMGAFFAFGAMIIIQVLANLFGISGNIFEFSYYGI